MRFSTIVATLALSVGLAVASPIVERDGVDVSGTSDGVPHYTDDNASGGGDASGPARRGVTMREAFNPLDARDGHHDRDFAILIVCKRDHCRGPCWGYNLDRVHFHKCYNVRPYRSVYIFSEHHKKHDDDDHHHHHRGHDDDDHHHHDEDYGVYVAKHKCKRHALIPKTNHCFNIKPYADQFFKWKKHDDDDDHHHHH